MPDQSQQSTHNEAPHPRGGHARRAFLTKGSALAGAALAVTAGSATTYATTRPASARTATRGETRSQQAAGEPRMTALTKATVIDGTGAPPRHGMTVLIRKGRIRAVGRAETVPVPKGARVVDLNGRYVIPGLIESHTHSSGPDEVTPALYPLTGVTTVREMQGEPQHHDWRARVERGELFGPRWIIGSPIIDGRPSIWSTDAGTVIRVGTPAEARRTVRRVQREGADFVKVYSRLTPETYTALADEARQQRLPFMGHCPDEVPIRQASDLGQRSIEHLHALLLATSGREKEIREELARIHIDPTEPDSLTRYNSWFRQVHPLEWRAVRSHDPRRARALHEHLAANGTSVVPTLSVHRVLELPEEVPESDETWKYQPPWLVSGWDDMLQQLTAGRSAEEKRRIRHTYEHRQRLVHDMAEAGVRLLAGTDTGTSHQVPGFSLHEELKLLVSSGLSPMRVLQAATREPARMLGLEHDIGTVEAGKAADLVVLDGDPLTDIANTLRIHALCVRGRYVTGVERSRRLREVAEAARRSEPPEGGPTTGIGCGCVLHAGL